MPRPQRLKVLLGLIVVGFAESLVEGGLVEGLVKVVGGGLAEDASCGHAPGARNVLLDQLRLLLGLGGIRECQEERQKHCEHGSGHKTCNAQLPWLRVACGGTC